jgi:radical SAM superfamily enzyme YgiQ (UPF0313 family)
MSEQKQVLLINPWIYDFAAYNLWIEPLGLLTIAAVLSSSGYGVSVLDCLAPHPGAPRLRADSSGKLYKEVVGKPGSVAMVPRQFGRYGLPLDQFERFLAAAPPPDVVMVASGMTYWYPGVTEVIRRVRARFGAVPVAVGGVYATLCSEHARQCSGADRVLPGPGVVAALQFADEVTGLNSEPKRYAQPQTWPPPAHELVSRPFAGVITSWGCPYHCTYCASQRLQPTFVQREPALVIDEIVACAQRGCHDLAFYDDALLLNAGDHLVPILNGIVKRGARMRFHAPNGVHAGRVSADLAMRLRQAGFATVRLSLETTDFARQRATGGKVTTGAFVQAVKHLNSAGFGPAELGAYILAGLPEQPLAEVETTVRFVHDLGVQAKLALFSPIPGTPEGDRALPPNADPLLHNNTVYPYLLGDDYVRDLQRIKQLAKDGNERLIHTCLARSSSSRAS